MTESQSPTAPEVLLAEDDPSLAEAVAEILGEVAPVVQEQSAAQAVARIERAHLGLVVTDLHLEGERFSGRKVIAAAKRKGVPVMLCSASTRDEVHACLGDLFPDGLLLKPFSIDELLSMAQRLFRRDSRSN